MEDVVRIGLPLGECVGLQHRQKLAAFPTQHRRGGAFMLGVSSSFNVHQILGNASNLRNSDKFKTVYLRPNCTPEERKVCKKLVASMRAQVLA